MAETQTALGILRMPALTLRGLESIELLVASSASPAFDIDLSLRGPRNLLDSRIDTDAYRVVQEGITNAAKYGDGRVDVLIAAEFSGLDISIRNHLSARAHGVTELGSSGAGLRGMKQRVEGRQGSLHTNVTNNEFRLHVRLPANAQ